MRPISQNDVQCSLQAVFAVEQNEDSDMTKCNISFLSPRGSEDMPDFCIENSLTRHLSLFPLHFTHFADEGFFWDDGPEAHHDEEPSQLCSLKHQLQKRPAVDMVSTHSFAFPEDSSTNGHISATLQFHL
ncbi:hypothetical protein NQZ68_016117 [Dissostichus eleginoides]|nr:hypothetical protein NQZ68_016117 [Dissostichus eleginoides]